MAILTGFTVPAKENPFAADVAELAAAGDDAAFELIAQTEKTEGVTGTISSKRAQFQDAAREAGFSARVVPTATEVREDGTTRIVLVLNARRTRAPKGEAKQGK